MSNGIVESADFLFYHLNTFSVGRVQAIAWRRRRNSSQQLSTGAAVDGAHRSRPILFHQDDRFLGRLTSAHRRCFGSVI